MKRNEDDDRDRLLSQLVRLTHSFLHLAGASHVVRTTLYPHLSARGNGSNSKGTFLFEEAENTSDGTGSSFRPFCRSRGTLTSAVCPSLSLSLSLSLYSHPNMQHELRFHDRQDANKNEDKKKDVESTPYVETSRHKKRR